MTRRLRALSAHALFVLLGLVLLTWPLTFGAHPGAECRGVPMHPGDNCHKSELDGTDRGRTQTYEERVATVRSANPLISGVGVVVTGFALVLLVSDLRRQRAEIASPPPHEGP